MKVGILGGSFDPIHLGHQLLVKEAIQALELDKLIVVVAYISPFKVEKPPFATPQQRLDMVKLALDGIDKVEVSSLEIDREGVSYTIDTVNTILEAYNDEKFYLIFSQDVIQSFPQFKDAELIKNKVEVVFAVHQEKPFPVAEEILIRVKGCECSSSMIREALLQGQDCQQFLSPKVLDYISQHKLYSKAYDNG